MSQRWRKMWLMVCHCLKLHSSDTASPHSYKLAWLGPWPIQKGFNSVHDGVAGRSQVAHEMVVDYRGQQPVFQLRTYVDRWCFCPYKVTRCKSLWWVVCYISVYWPLRLDLIVDSRLFMATLQQRDGGLMGYIGQHWQLWNLGGHTHPKIRCMVLLIWQSMDALWLDLDHAGQQYSATEQHRSRASVRRVLALVPHEVPDTLERSSGSWTWQQFSTYALHMSKCGPG